MVYKSMVGYQVSQTLGGTSRGSAVKRAGPLFLVHKSLDDFIGSYFKISFSPNIYCVPLYH